MTHKILILMTGSIATYKACGILSSLKQKGHELEVIMSPSALKFVGAATIEGLIGKSPIVDMYEPGRVMDHIHLQRWADLILVAPATAHFINRLAAGIGDDLASTLFLAHDFKKPFLIAPAMNTKMYLHPTSQKSMDYLKSLGVEILESASGVLACGESGWGRLLEPKDIVTEVENRLSQKSSQPHSTAVQKPHTAKRVLVTAGGTIEPLDAVRSLTNESTGRTGYQIAQTLFQLGFDVDLLLSKSHSIEQTLNEGEGFRIQFFSSFQSLHDLMKENLSQKSYATVIHAAAVSDFSLAGKPVKSKMDSSKDLVLKLKRNPKIIDSIKKWSKNKKVMLIGFKLTANAKESDILKKVTSVFQKAKADFVVQNDTTNISRNQTKPAHSFRLYKSDLSYISIKETEELLFNLSQNLQNEVNV